MKRHLCSGVNLRYNHNSRQSRPVCVCLSCAFHRTCCRKRDRSPRLFRKGRKEQGAAAGQLLPMPPGWDGFFLLTLLVRKVVVFFVWAEGLSVGKDRSVASVTSALTVVWKMKPGS